MEYSTDMCTYTQPGGI